MDTTETGDSPHVNTGVLTEHVCAKICSQGCEEIDLQQAVGPGNYSFRAFKVFSNDKWKHFTIPAAMGPDGYQLWELAVIEWTLASFGIELLPLDLHLH